LGILLPFKPICPALGRVSSSLRLVEEALGAATACPYAGRLNAAQITCKNADAQEEALRLSGSRN
jgi:hypothetical protein